MITWLRRLICRHTNAMIQRGEGRMWMECPDCGHVSAGVEIKSAQGGAE